jgi:NADPH:quinone reductase-like Zn-dependent oxidoreductase
MRTMKAVRAHRRGGPEQLVFEVAPRPEPAPGEAIVAVRAASITPDEFTWDATWTDRVEPGGRDRTPIIPSHEVSGVVAALGPGAVDLTVGDEVYGLIPFVRDGAAAEFVSVPANVLAPKPAAVGHDVAAAIPLSALTAWQALALHGNVTLDQHVLVQGAAGGVGTFAVQMAVHLGARVSATARQADRAFVEALGATQFVAYETDRFEDRVKDVDVVLDLVGGETQTRSFRVLRSGGVLVSIVAPPNGAHAGEHGARGVFFVVEPSRHQLKGIARLVDAGRIRPVVDHVVGLADTRTAYEALATEHRRGKVVIHVSGEANLT